MKILKKKKIYLLIATFLIIIGVIFIHPNQKSVVQTQTLTLNSLQQTITATGSIDANSSVDLSFLSAGTLVYLGAKKGDSVQANQTIAMLDERTVEKNLQTALRNYAEQRNTFDQNLSNNNAKSLNDAVNDTVKRILQNNQYDLEKAVLSVELQDLARQQSILTTPIAGIVTREDVTTPGVNVSTTTTFSVVDPSSFIFKVDIDEADIGKVSIGQPIQINLDSFPDTTLNLTVTYIDFTSHTTSTGETAFTVQAKLPINSTHQYRIGMNGNADIITAERKNVITVPLSSVINNNNVYVKTKNGFQKRTVTIGLENDTDAEITSGLHQGDVIALQPTDVEKITK